MSADSSFACARPPDAAPFAASLRRKCACGTHTPDGGECRDCASKRLRRSSAGRSSPMLVPSLVHDVLAMAGRPLEPATRNWMEPRFGSDFSRVRVHDDGHAAASARAVGALAYAVGSHVVFDARQYAPGTPAGRHLLAHELAHTLQDPGAGGEIQLTDSMAKLMESQDFHAFAYAGRSYDCGDKVNYLRAVAAFALKNADLGAEARRALLEELDRSDQPALRAAR